MLETIAQSSVASTNLLNALKLINRENELVSQNREVVNRFEQCKSRPGSTAPALVSTF